MASDKHRAELLARFLADVRLGIDYARAHGYPPHRFEAMINRLGPLDTARRLLRPGANWQEGFARMFELGAPHYTIEARVVQPEYASLFTDSERAEAQRRLTLLQRPKLTT